jgi:hypothetical protein
MAKTTSLYLPKGANTASVTFTSADTTALKTLFTAGADDSDLKSVIAVTDDTAAINLKVYVTRGGTDYLIATVNIPIASGTNGTTPAVDVLNAISFPGLPMDSVQKRYLPLKTGDVVKVACLATMTAAKTLTVSAFGQDY